MLHIRFHVDNTNVMDDLSEFSNNLKHLSPTCEGYFFLDGDVLVFVSNVASFEFAYDLVHSIQKRLDEISVYSDVLSFILN